MLDSYLNNEQQLQGYMMNRVVEYLRKKGRKAIVWNEAVNGGNLEPDIIIQFWTEYIRNNERLEELYWPRFSAAAEAGWCGGKREGYNSYQNRLKSLFFLFDENGIQATKENGWIPSEEEREISLPNLKRTLWRQIWKSSKRHRKKSNLVADIVCRML